MKKGAVVLLAVIFTAVGTPTAVQAQDSTNNNSNYSLDDVMQARQEIAQSQAEQQEQRQTRRQAVCEQLQARINNRLNSYETNKDKYHSRYRGIHTKVTDLADKLEDQDCDVAQIRTDLATFDELLKDFADSFRIFVEHMKTARTQACDDTDIQFRTQAGTAREYLLAMRQKAEVLHQFIKGTLKTHVTQTAQACRAQVSESQE